ncbi:MAG TPA: aminomethyl-transferring glycine dehydrogenase subunit GcvPA [Verrucomicrobia bacterium]|nr:MAG: glycine dehydrogenase (aminomethyl-transferring) [Lentisphaerae bacterium GWF2_57_35]HBA86105.1 aminomethyl-transferring glycine dehydrogenase subunit GcvPA [Verrucomicrobiota bacterium]
MSHTNFCVASEQDKAEMLKAVKAKSFDDLFVDIPAEFQTDAFNIPEGRSELEALQTLRGLAAKNATNLTNFCGAGYYDHFIPAAVDSLSGRGEFYTAYTPYQPEAAQGTLQAIYEYQTDMARLTGMEVSNASLYDGGTALFEGIMMALRTTGRDKVLIDEGVSPIYRTMLRCYTRNLSIQYEEIPLAKGLADRAAFKQKLSKEIGAVVVQNPNFFGSLDDLTDLVAAAHGVGAQAVFSVYPLSLGLVKTPGAMGADIVTGEGQSLGLPLSFGGPYLGFMTTLKKFVRKMPGRIVGATQDEQGRRGYVLTLQAREQHIRREKATSNICTNEALCALRAHMYLSLLGKQGLVDVAQCCASLAAYARERLCAIRGVRPTFEQPFFNEFALTLPRDASDVVSALIDHGIAAGFPVGRYYKGMENVLLLAFTEKRTKEEIDLLAARLEGNL